MKYKLNEQETAINYDRQLGYWTFYSTVQADCRHWDKAVVDDAVREYNENGTLIMLNGRIEDDWYFKPRQRRKMTDEQRQMAAKRLAKANAKKKEPETSHQESNNSTLLQDMKKGLNRGRRTR